MNYDKNIKMSGIVSLVWLFLLISSIMRHSVMNIVFYSVALALSGSLFIITLIKKSKEQ